LKNLILETGFKMAKVVISDLQNNTFYALIELVDKRGRKLTLDARPSDAIALALRLDCTIFVKQKVFEISSAPIEAESNLVSEINSSPDEWPELIS